ncbi:hypothetical protein MACK_002423 [Theileria orientalis]|uniref:Uncharacterized protein n=1 Tax=Theileria orientalis TaxID=68886 RepID=A0A976QUB2_THEOR|nr:hypothetical protein MACK_002423 [Theileria orientalis]
MKVLTVLTILYSYQVCKCINSDDEDKAKAEVEEIILGMTDEQLEEQMKNLRLGARPKTRAPLTNQFPIDYRSVKEKDVLKAMEKVLEDEEEDILEKEKALREKERRLHREEKRLQEEARRLEREEQRICEQSKMRKLHEIHEGKEVKHLTYGYPKYDPNVKHFAPTFMYRPVDPQMLEKPPGSLSYKSYDSKQETDNSEEFVPEIPPPPTNFPRPCQCSCRPKYLDQHQNDSNEPQQDQGAAGGQQQQQGIQPQQSTPSRQRRGRDDSDFEAHKDFPPYGPGSMPQVPFGGVPVLPPPPPPPPFQNVRPPVPSPDEPQVKKPAMYDDITPPKVSVSVEIKKGRSAFKSNCIQRYGRNGRLCHIYIPLPNYDYKEVTYRDQTIWRTRNDKRCTRVELCNIGDEDKIVYLDFNRGSSARYKKVKNRWYKI